MMGMMKDIFTDWKTILLIVLLAASLALINPTFDDGVVVRSVDEGSPAAQASPTQIESPGPSINPRAREELLAVNDNEIGSVQEYRNATQDLEPNQTVSLQTDQETYIMTTAAGDNRSASDLGINVMEKPASNIRLGLDLAGGTRVLLEPDEEVTDEELGLIADNIEQRLNVFGVTDVTVRTTTDLFQDSFVIVEIAGVTEDEIRELLSQQGVFEAKIGNQTVFTGGDEDIQRVCRSPDCSGLSIQSPCREGPDGEWTCGFFFSITLSDRAAQAHADATRDLNVINAGGQQYLEENISLFLDGELVDQLRIGAELQGNPTNSIRISGSGSGQDREAAQQDAISEMNNLQTIMVTGSLPVTLSIVRADTVSPSLGEAFLNEALLAGLLAILGVIAVVAIRYREMKLTIPMALTMLAEVILILGFAALINWNMDMAAIAAIVIAIGSGVDDQIVIADETLEGNNRRRGKASWKDRLDKAFFIIMAAYFTLLFAMVPLWFAGAGLLRGFALTTVVGVTVGVMLTRPVFAHVLEVILDE